MDSFNFTLTDVLSNYLRFHCHVITDYCQCVHPVGVGGLFLLVWPLLTKNQETGSALPRCMHLPITYLPSSGPLLN